MNINDFFNSNSSLTNFINSLCALLNIVDTSTVKVVGVYSGSVTLVAEITPPVSTNSSTPSLTTTNTVLNAAIASGSFGTAMNGAGLPGYMGASSIYNILNPDSSSASASSSGSTNVGLIVGLVMAGLTLVIGSVVTFICCIRRRSKVAEKMVSHE
jgi:hypothetical protein